MHDLIRDPIQLLGLLLIWALLQLVLYPARNHLRRAVLGIGRAIDRGLRFLALSLRRAVVAHVRREAVFDRRDPGRKLRARIRFWLGLVVLAFTTLCALLFIAPYDDDKTALVLLGFVTLAGAQLSFDIGLLDVPARLLRLRPRARRVMTAGSAALLVGVAIGRAALVNSDGLGASLTALLLPLPIAGLPFIFAMMISGARVLVPVGRARLAFALYVSISVLRAPVLPLFAAVDALVRALVAPARALAKKGSLPAFHVDLTGPRALERSSDLHSPP